MAGIDDILAQLPIGDIAAKLGVDTATAEQAVKEGGATILGGLHRNAESADGAAALEKALAKHAGAPATIDEADGSKILGHIFGDDTQAVASQLTSNEKTAGIDFGALLPVIAPIIMNLIANKGGAATTTTTTTASSGGIGDVIGGILGSLGGSSSSSSSSSSGGLDLGGIIGGLGGLFGKK